MTDRLPAPDLDRIDAFVRDLESIPDVIDRALDPGWMADALALATSRRFSRILLAGLGSSRFALMLAEDLFHTGFARFIAEPANPDRTPPPSEDVLTVAISASGRTREAVALAERSRGPGSVLAITRDPASPLAASADALAALPVEAESSGIACTTFVATVIALFHLGLGLKGQGQGQGVAERLGGSADATRELLATRDAWLPPALEALDGVEDIAVLAPWSQRGAAEQAALHMRECPRRSAAAYETAEWLHVGIYTALPGSAVLVFDGSPADDEVGQVSADRGVRLVRIPGSPGDAITRSTAASLLAAELWRVIAS